MGQECVDPSCAESDCLQQRALAAVTGMMNNMAGKAAPAKEAAEHPATKKSVDIAQLLSMLGVPPSTPATPDPKTAQDDLLKKLVGQVDELMAALKTKEEEKKAAGPTCIIILDPENRTCKHCRSVTVLCECTHHKDAKICDCCDTCHKVECICCDICDCAPDDCDCCKKCESLSYDCTCCEQCDKINDECTCCKNCDEKAEKCKCCKECKYTEGNCECCEKCKKYDDACTCCGDCENKVNECTCCKVCGVSDKKADCTCCPTCGVDKGEHTYCRKCDYVTPRPDVHNVSFKGDQRSMLNIIPTASDCSYCQVLESSMPGQPAARHNHMIVVKTDAKNTYVNLCNQCKNLWIQSPSGWTPAVVIDGEELKNGNFVTKYSDKFPALAKAAAAGSGAMVPVLSKAAAVPFLAGMVAGATAWVAGPAIRKALPWVKSFLPKSIGQHVDNPVVQLIIQNLGRPVEIPGFEEEKVAVADVAEETTVDENGKTVKTLKVKVGEPEKKS